MKIGKTIYLDHQATTPLEPRVLSAMLPYYRDSFGNPHSHDHSLGWESARAVEDARARISQLIGADVDEITFTSSATESVNLALLGLAHRAVGSKRRRILVSAIEHKCVLAVCRVIAERYGFIIEQIAVDNEGFIVLQALEDALDDNVLAVSIIAVNNEIGVIQDIERISQCVRKHGVIFHCDAAQAPIGMQTTSLALHTDILSLSGHKMYAPQGIGAIFITRGLEQRIEPLIYGGGQQNGLRSGTVPVALCVGMGAAAEFLIGDEGQKLRSELGFRRDIFIDRIMQLDWSTYVNGTLGSSRHPGNANICFSGFAAQDILGALQPHLAASSGSACASGIPEPSHVLRAIGLSSDDAESSIRFSLGFGTTAVDIDRAVSLIDGALRRLSET